jgi:hypothetical protein
MIGNATKIGVSTAVKNRNMAVEYAKLVQNLKGLTETKEKLRLALLQAMSTGEEILTDYGLVRKEVAHEVVVDDVLVSWLRKAGHFNTVKKEEVSVRKLRMLGELNEEVSKQIRFENTYKIAVKD